MKTFAPPSVADSTIFGVKISVKPAASSAARKPAALAAATSKPDRSSGCRRVVGAWSRIVGSVAVRAGRYRSNGGGSRRARQHDHDRLGELGAAGCLSVRDDEALDLQDGLLGCLRGRRLRGRRFPPGRCGTRGRQDDLGQPGPVADDEEGY